MRDIPWKKVLGAIQMGDAAGLRLLAEEARGEQRRQLLQVFAGIVESGTPIGKREALPRIAAHLVSPGVPQPFPAASVRGQQCSCRTALYRADGYSIELRLEHERGSRRIDLVGQIASRRPRWEPQKTVVLLMSGRDLVARAVSDGFGEFHMQCAPARSLSLCVPLQPWGKEIEIHLSKLISRFLLHCGKRESGTPDARA